MLGRCFERLRCEGLFKGSVEKFVLRGFVERLRREDVLREGVLRGYVERVCLGVLRSCIERVFLKGVLRGLC